MYYKYFTKLIGNTYAKWQYLPATNESIWARNVNAFSTIEDWDDDGNKRCPIYADFDYAGALEDARDYVTTIQKILNVTPNIFFSGNKGFHVVVPLYIVDPNCEKIVKYIIDKLGTWNTLDDHMYKSRNMWRLANSLHAKSGLRKVPISINELMTYDLDDIRKLANRQRFISMIKAYDNVNAEFLRDTIAEAKEVIKEYEDKVEIKSSDLNWNSDMPPCIFKLINTEAKDGDWHHTLFTIARYFEVGGASPSEAINMLLQYKHWAQDSEYVERTVLNTYKSNGVKTFGCRNNKLLQKNCVPHLCKYYKDDKK